MSESFIKGKTFRNITSVKCDLKEKVCLVFEKLEHREQVEGIDSLITEFKGKARLDADKDEVNIDSTFPLTCSVIMGPPFLTEDRFGKRETSLRCEQ